MAHELNMTGGKAAMAFVKSEGTPWHGLGTPVHEAMTSWEAMKQGGLMYDVAKLRCYADHPTEPGKRVEAPNTYLTVRTDSLDVLGVVSEQYTPVQNHEAFAFLDSLVGEGFRYHTVGALGKGERVWMLGRVPGSVNVKGVDLVENYLALTNGHDGKTALKVFFTPIRIVCANTLGIALDKIGVGGVTLSHTGDLDKKIQDARNILGMASDFFKAFGDGAQLLADYRPSKVQIANYWNELYPDPAGKPEGSGTKAKTTRAALHGLFETGKGHDQKAIAHSAWCAFNAVTEYVDHHVGKPGEKRLREALFEDGRKVKAKAWDLAMSMCTGGLTDSLKN